LAGTGCDLLRQQRTQDGVRPAISPRPLARNELRDQDGLTLQHLGIALGGGPGPGGREDARDPVRPFGPGDPVDADIQLNDPETAMPYSCSR
jgi:hypothetical protein